MTRTVVGPNTRHAPFGSCLKKARPGPPARPARTPGPPGLAPRAVDASGRMQLKRDEYMNTQLKNVDDNIRLTRYVLIIKKLRDRPQY